MCVQPGVEARSDPSAAGCSFASPNIHRDHELLYRMCSFTSFLPRQMAAATFSPRIQILLLLCYSVWSLHSPRATSLSFTANFSRPGGHDATKHLRFKRDARFDHHSRMIHLTKAGGSPSNSVGRVLHKNPVNLWDAATGELAGFNTSFTFRIKAANSSTSGGDGLAFFLGHHPPTSIPDPLNNGRNLGLYPKDVRVAIGANRAVAVEFDTLRNPEVDHCGSHMGIDVNSIASWPYANATLPDRNLKSGLPMTCHISYGNHTQILAAVLQVGNATYNVSTTVDLRDHLPSVVAIGFSAATGRGVEIHQIISWSFNSTLDPSMQSFKVLQPKSPKMMWKQRVEVIIGVIAIVCIFVGARRWQLCTRRKRYRALAGGLPHVDYHKLAHAANRFAKENKLGEEGSASVYQGQLTSPTRAVAGRKAFEDELRIASRLRHRNLVELIGWCYDGPRNLVEFICWWRDDRYMRLFLVYELLPQGSLDKHMHGATVGCHGPRGTHYNSILRAFTSYEIIFDLGCALQYLHVDCEQGQQCIYPVFIDMSQRNRQSDIYSFGIVLLEMVSGRDPTMRLHDRPSLSSWVRSSYHSNVILDVVDEKLISDESSAVRQQMERTLLIGLLCVHSDPSIRPSITHIMEALRSEELTLDIAPLASVTLLLP
ncbi:hypothetical protein VPH35_047748 [Triticum aestivum]